MLKYLRWYLDWIHLLGKPDMSVLRREVVELQAERLLSMKWWGELGDVIHTAFRIINPYLGFLVLPVCIKHGKRYMEMTHAFDRAEAYYDSMNDMRY